MKEIFKIADEENLTIQEVRRVLKVNFIINAMGEPYEAFKDKSLVDSWYNIPEFRKNLKQGESLLKNLTTK